jgi:hypothetical protein
MLAQQSRCQPPAALVPQQRRWPGAHPRAPSTRPHVARPREMPEFISIGEGDVLRTPKKRLELWPSYEFSMEQALEAQLQVGRRPAQAALLPSSGARHQADRARLPHPRAPPASRSPRRSGTTTARTWTTGWRSCTASPTSTPLSAADTLGEGPAAAALPPSPQPLPATIAAAADQPPAAHRLQPLLRPRPVRALQVRVHARPRTPASGRPSALPAPLPHPAPPPQPPRRPPPQAHPAHALLRHAA